MMFVVKFIVYLLPYLLEIRYFWINTGMNMFTETPAETPGTSSAEKRRSRANQHRATVYGRDRSGNRRAAADDRAIPAIGR